MGFQPHALLIPLQFSICSHLPHILTPSALFIDGGGRQRGGLFAACNLRGVGVSVANQTKQEGRAADANAGN